jgi:Phage integrase, N-terminal SAM-like domain
MTTEAITPLRQRMIEDMNARKLCVGTQRGHILSCKRFAAFLKRSPDAATCEDIRGFQLHLADTGMSICNRNRIMTSRRGAFGGVAWRTGNGSRSWPVAIIGLIASATYWQQLSA